MSIEDLVRAKQTQRNKDWPMLARLVERVYFDVRDSPAQEELNFLLRELRNTELLVDAVARFPLAAQEIAPHRPAVQAALSGDVDQVYAALRTEQDEAIRRDRLWWEPLKRELEQFCNQR